MGEGKQGRQTHSRRDRERERKELRAIASFESTGFQKNGGKKKNKKEREETKEQKPVILQHTFLRVFECVGKRNVVLLEGHKKRETGRKLPFEKEKQKKWRRRRRKKMMMREKEK